MAAKLSVCTINWVTSPPMLVLLPLHPNSNQQMRLVRPERATTLITCASLFGNLSFGPAAKRCQKCGGQGAIECPGCKGTGKNKKNGNMFERWKCYDCQGFGLRSCPSCGKGGLTPEQRGER